jgi:membrane protein DedA with SNARE-associated domain
LDLKKFTLYTAIGGAIYCSFAIGISWALTGVFKGFYRALVLKLESPLGAGLIVGAAVISLVGSSMIAARLYKNEAQKEGE